MAKDVTDADVAQFFKSNANAVLDAWAPWCKPCKPMGLLLDELAVEYGARVAVAKINSDENTATATKYGIMSLPTVLLVRNGVVVDRLVGAMPKDKVKARIDAAFGL